MLNAQDQHDGYDREPLPAGAAQTIDASGEPEEIAKGWLFTGLQRRAGAKTRNGKKACQQEFKQNQFVHQVTLQSRMSDDSHGSHEAGSVYTSASAARAYEPAAMGWKQFSRIYRPARSAPRSACKWLSSTRGELYVLLEGGFSGLEHRKSNSNFLSRILPNASFLELVNAA